MKIQLRNAGTPDLNAILAIVNDAILNTTAIYDYDARTLEEQAAWLEEKHLQGFPVVVACDEKGAVLAFGTYGQFKAKIGY
ncbi:MAG TPA: N-acetyltransferase, partial [Flavobacterium sp.]|nr:N-acetyltransferase [Flavobacterium sp.]